MTRELVPNQKTTAIQAMRKAKLAQVEEAILTLSSQSKQSQKDKTTFGLLKSVSDGLYEEIDKLSKKAPAEKVTDLVLTQINEVVKETKELVKNDAYVQRLKEFVAAGDNPEHRDAVVVLKQLRQGLDRFFLDLRNHNELLEKKLSDARGISIALQIILQGKLPDTGDLRFNDVKVSDFWHESSSPYHIRLDRLDGTDLNAFLSVEK